MERIVVEDTNIFFDLLELGVFAEFFALPWAVFTTDFVIQELEEPRQRAEVLNFKNTGKLNVASLTSEEIAAIFDISQETDFKVSITDYSVLFFAKKYGCTLLTGDKRLRSKAQEEKLEVHGVLFVFDELVKHGIIPAFHAAELLKQLHQMSQRYLPKSEIEDRIHKWENPVSTDDGMEES